MTTTSMSALIAAVSAALLSCNPVAAQPDAAAATAAEQSQPERFTVIEAGTPGKPDVLMLPGLTSGRRVWRDEAARLSPTYRLHLLQVRGFAGEPAGANADADPLLPALVEDLHAYIAHRRIRPIVIGHSLGGLLGLMLARKYPEDVAKLVVVDASPFWGLMFGPQSTLASVAPQARVMRDNTLKQTPAQLEAVERWTAQLLAIDPIAQRWIVEDALASDRRVFARAMYEDLMTDLRPELSHIKAPTLVIHALDPTITFPDGTKPTAVSADTLMRDAYRGLPRVQLQRIDDSRHFVMTDQSARLHEAITAFLDRP